MTVNADYALIEQIASDLRGLLPCKIEDATPFIPNTAEFDKRLLVTIEGAKVVNFWVVQWTALTPTQFATQAQRESRSIAIYGYIAMSEKLGIPNATDVRVSDPIASGTATAGDTTTLTDSAASFGTYTDTHDLWVTYADGTVDHRRIASNTGTVITVRKAFDTAVAVGSTYEVWLRPSYWLLWEQARSVLDSLTTNRSQSGKAVTGGLPPVTIEAVTLYEMAFWRASFELTRDTFASKTYA